MSSSFGDMRQTGKAGSGLAAEGSLALFHARVDKEDIMWDLANT